MKHILNDQVMKYTKFRIREWQFSTLAKWIMVMMLVVGFYSCSKDETTRPAPTEDPISISGSYDVSDEIALSGPSAWAAGDSISYFDNLAETATRNLKMPLISGLNGTVGEFSGVLVDNTAQPNRKVSAAYPAAYATFSDSGLLRMTIPQMQTQNGSYDIISLNKYCMMVGTSVTTNEIPSATSVNIPFNHITSLVDINITNIPIGENVQSVMIGIPDSVDASPIVLASDYDVLTNTLTPIPVVYAKNIGVNVNGVTDRSVVATVSVLPMDLTAYSDVMRVLITTKKADNTITERAFVTRKLARVYTSGERFALTVDAGLSTGDAEYGEVRFGGMIFMDRNLGATIATNEENIDDPRSYGNYYQFGLAAPYSYSLVVAGNLPTIQGPLAHEAGKISSSFITVTSGSWSSSPWTWTGVNATDKWILWTGITPAPTGWRVPSNQDAFIVMQGSNTVTPRFASGTPVFQNQNLAYMDGTFANIGISAGDGKTVYGIKKYGTEAAYAIRWEYKTSPAGRGYIKLTAIPGIGTLGDFAGSTNEEKLASAIAMFNNVTNQAAFQTLVYPALGSITNAGTLSGNNSDILYWNSGTSSANGYAMYTNISGTYNGVLYTVKAPSYGMPIRCVKSE